MESDFNYPGQLSVDKDGYLTVCHSIQVLELGGSFVTKFGSKGSENGQFTYPISTANLSNSRKVCLIAVITGYTYLSQYDFFSTLTYNR